MGNNYQDKDNISLCQLVSALCSDPESKGFLSLYFKENFPHKTIKF